MPWWNFAANVGAALLMGAAIGLERQWRQHTAGLRTNALVTLGAAVFVSLARLMDHESSPTRIAAQVVSGIGFLGGGVILREGFNVRGMNTAATLWCSAAVGTLVGAGFLLEGLTATAAVLFLHIALRPAARMLEMRLHTASDVETTYHIHVTCPHGQEAVIRTVFLRHINSQPRMTLQGISTQEDQPAGTATVVATVYAVERNDRFMEEMVSRLSIEPGVHAVSWDRGPTAR